MIKIVPSSKKFPLSASRVAESGDHFDLEQFWATRIMRQPVLVKVKGGCPLQHGMRGEEGGYPSARLFGLRLKKGACVVPPRNAKSKKVPLSTVLAPRLFVVSSEREQVVLPQVLDVI